MPLRHYQNTLFTMNLSRISTLAKSIVTFRTSQPLKSSKRQEGYHFDKLFTRDWYMRSAFVKYFNIRLLDIHPWTLISRRSTPCALTSFRLLWYHSVNSHLMSTDNTLWTLTRHELSKHSTRFYFTPFYQRVRAASLLTFVMRPVASTAICELSSHAKALRALWRHSVSSVTVLRVNRTESTKSDEIRTDEIRIDRNPNRSKSEPNENRTGENRTRTTHSKWKLLNTVATSVCNTNEQQDRVPPPKPHLKCSWAFCETQEQNVFLLALERSRNFRLIFN